MQITEAQIQAQIVEYLSLRGIFCHSVPNEGAGANKIRTIRLITMGLKPGTADLVIWLPGGKIGYLEVKTQSGRLSEKQKQFRQRCLDNGVFYAVVKSVEDVETILKEQVRKRDG